MKIFPLEKAYHKVVAVIESCETKNQLEGALKMVMNFKTLYGVVGYQRILYYKLDRLIDKQTAKWV